MPIKFKAVWIIQIIFFIKIKNQNTGSPPISQLPWLSELFHEILSQICKKKIKITILQVHLHIIDLLGYKFSLFWSSIEEHFADLLTMNFIFSWNFLKSSDITVWTTSLKCLTFLKISDNVRSFYGFICLLSMSLRRFPKPDTQLCRSPIQVYNKLKPSLQGYLSPLMRKRFLILRVSRIFIENLLLF